MNSRISSALPVVILILLGGFIFTLGIADNYTNIDEPYFTDPVVNYLNGNGYTTTSWRITGPTETHVSTAPAHSLALLLWLKLFGFSQAAVRSLSAALALGSALVFWRACRRAGLIHSAPAGIIVISLVLLDHGYAFSYSVGRPDALSALLAAALFYFSTLANQRLALGLMGALAVLLPFVQWGLVMYLAVLSAALWLIDRKRTWKYILVVGAGMALGLLIQRVVYGQFGVWETWLDSVRSERLDNVAKMISSRPAWSTFLNRHSNTMPKDFSALVILAGMAFLYVRSRRRRRPEGVLLARSAWIIVVTVTLGMFFIGKFPTYYGWMLMLPLAAILGHGFDRFRSAGGGEARLIVGITLLAGGVGLPLEVIVASHDWNDRQPAAITAWLGPKIGPDDVVYCDYPFYYVAKPRAKQVFTSFYFNRMSPEEYHRLTLVIISQYRSYWKPERYALTNALETGRWQPARSGWLGNSFQYGILSPPNYGCTVYRLKAADKP
jgi:hypothetical protein